MVHHGTKRRLHSHSHSRKSSSKKRSGKPGKRSGKRSGKRGGHIPVTFVGPAWSPAANNTHAALTAPSARANHFAVSHNGIQAGGIDPARPEMWGPGINDINVLPPLQKGGRRNLKRSKQGGYVFGGFPQVASTALQNALNGIKNIWHGYNGQPQLPSASGWHQPYLLQQANNNNNNDTGSSAMKQLATIEKAVTQRVANA